ncbi:MAG: hypothetical protein SF187_15350 [Deltaproteobacteria bacterium]|nr:hypothetical protein [Deltaproteobacteria bacterium]
MPLVFEEVHATSDRKKVNEEWFVLANNGSSPISSAGLNVVVARKGKRGSVLGQLDPGFVLAPGEKILVLSGSPGKKSQGTLPDKPGLKTYYLFSHEPLLSGDGTTIRWTLNQLDVARVVYSASAPNGIATE